MLDVLISAGEASGDMHAAALLAAARRRGEAIRWRGIAGPAMRAEGCQVLARMEALNVMGIGDVLRAMPRIRRVEQSVLAQCMARRPDVAVLVDFPGFHMRLGRKLRAMGVPVVQYIAPKLWAWGAWRVRTLAASQDMLASILPFEPAWFAAHGIDAHYVGNPSVVSCRQGWDAVALRAQLGIDASQRMVALLPGSRAGELRRHLPILRAVLERLRRRHAEMHFIVPVARGVAPAELAMLEGARTHLLARETPGFSLRGVHAAVAVSGTATLELALWDVPTVLIYQAPPLMAWLARRLIRLPWVGLVNILLEREAMPELLQQHCRPERICAQLERLLQEPEMQRQAFVELRRLLGDHDPAPQLLARLRRLAQAGGMGVAGDSPTA